jgi:F-type H+-transporting ATPase subunit b
MLELNWTILVQMVWLILAWIFLSRLLFKPMLRLLELRRSKTVGLSKEASRLREEAGIVLSQVEEKLRKVRQEASEIYQSAREKSLAETRTRVEETHQEIEKLKAVATQKMEAEIHELRREMGVRAQEIAPFVVSKILSVSLAILFLVPTSVGAEASEPVGHAEGLFTWRFLFTWVNFLLLVFVLWKWVGPRLREFLTERRQSIQEAIQGAEAQMQEARRKLEEARQRWSRLDQEIENIRARVLKQAILERDQLLSQTKDLTRKMVVEAGELMEVERRELTDRIRREWVEAVIQLAEQRIRAEMKPEIESRWLDQSVEHLKELS